MPLDTSAYSLALLRLDGRRWNELRRLHGQISTQAAADGSSYLEMGNTKVICTVTGPAEGRRGTAQRDSADAAVEVNISIAGFSQVDRKRRRGTDKRTSELQHTISSAFASILHTHLYPHSTITVQLHVLSDDGALLASLINATTLALIDAGIPMTDYLSACTAGSTVNSSSSRGAPPKPATLPGLTSGGAVEDDIDDPLLDLNSLEEQELPFLTVATVGGSQRVEVLMLETRMQVDRLEEMLAVGVDGCRQIRGMLDGVVKAHGERLLEEG